MSKEDAPFYGSGDKGDLDIWNVYLPASSEKERLDCIQAFVANISPQEWVLTLLMGDWNLTDHLHDRFCRK